MLIFYVRDYRKGKNLKNTNKGKETEIDVAQTPSLSRYLRIQGIKHTGHFSCTPQHYHSLHQTEFTLSNNMPKQRITIIKPDVNLTKQQIKITKQGVAIIKQHKNVTKRHVTVSTQRRKEYERKYTKKCFTLTPGLRQAQPPGFELMPHTLGKWIIEPSKFK